MGSEDYGVLGVSPKDSLHVIERAYKKLAIRYHPDKNEGRAEFNGLFATLNRAWNNIKNERLIQVDVENTGVKGQNGVFIQKLVDKKPSEEYMKLFETAKAEFESRSQETVYTNNFSDYYSTLLSSAELVNRTAYGSNPDESTGSGAGGLCPTCNYSFHDLKAHLEDQVGSYYSALLRHFGKGQELNVNINLETVLKESLCEQVLSWCPDLIEKPSLLLYWERVFSTDRNIQRTQWTLVTEALGKIKSDGGGFDLTQFMSTSDDSLSVEGKELILHLLFASEETVFGHLTSALAECHKLSSVETRMQVLLIYPAFLSIFHAYNKRDFCRLAERFIHEGHYGLALVFIEMTMSGLDKSWSFRFWTNQSYWDFGLKVLLRLRERGGANAPPTPTTALDFVHTCFILEGGEKGVELRLKKKGLLDTLQTHLIIQGKTEELLVHGLHFIQTSKPHSAQYLIGQRFLLSAYRLQAKHFHFERRQRLAKSGEEESESGLTGVLETVLKIVETVSSNSKRGKGTFDVMIDILRSTPSFLLTSHMCNHIILNHLIDDVKSLSCSPIVEEERRDYVTWTLSSAIPTILHILDHLHSTNQNKQRKGKGGGEELKAMNTSFWTITLPLVLNNLFINNFWYVSELTPLLALRNCVPALSETLRGVGMLGEVPRVGRDYMVRIESEPNVCKQTLVHFLLGCWLWHKEATEKACLHWGHAVFTEGAPREIVTAVSDFLTHSPSVTRTMTQNWFAQLNALKQLFTKYNNNNNNNGDGLTILKGKLEKGMGPLLSVTHHGVAQKGGREEGEGDDGSPIETMILKIYPFLKLERVIQRVVRYPLVAKSNTQDFAASEGMRLEEEELTEEECMTRGLAYIDFSVLTGLEQYIGGLVMAGWNFCRASHLATTIPKKMAYRSLIERVTGCLQHMHLRCSPALAAYTGMSVMTLWVHSDLSIALALATQDSPSLSPSPEPGEAKVLGIGSMSQSTLLGGWVQVLTQLHLIRPLHSYTLLNVFSTHQIGVNGREFLNTWLRKRCVVAERNPMDWTSPSSHTTSTSLLSWDTFLGRGRGVKDMRVMRVMSVRRTTHPPRTRRTPHPPRTRDKSVKRVKRVTVHPDPQPQLRSLGLSLLD